MRGALAHVGLLALATLVALFSAEGVVRLLPASVLGFAYADRRFAPPPEFEVQTSLNRYGSHDVPYGPKPPGVRRVLLLGDSFVQGLAVPVEKTLSRRLEHHLSRRASKRYDVVALAGSGFGQAEELELLRRHASELEPDLVVTIFYMNDVAQSKGRKEIQKFVRQPSARRLSQRLDTFAADEADGLWIEVSALNRLVSHRLTLARRKREARGVPFPFLVYEVPLDPFFVEAWSTTRKLLLETRESAAHLGADYALVSVGSSFGITGDLSGLLDSYPEMRERRWDLEAPDRVLADFAGDEGIPLLALQPVFRAALRSGGPALHWKYDGHWTAAGHDLAAAEVARFVLARDEGDEARLRTGAGEEPEHAPRAAR